MKILRKFISVLCVATMTTSCAVVSASANGPEEYKQTRAKIARNIARLEELKKLAQEVSPQESSGEITEIKKQNKIQNKIIKNEKLRNIRKNNPIQNLVDVKNDENHQQKQSKIEEKIIKNQNLPNIWKKNRPKIQNKIINIEKLRNMNKNDQIKEKKGIIKYVIDLKNKQRHRIIEKKIVMPNKNSNDNYEKLCIFEVNINCRTRKHSEIRPAANNSTDNMKRKIKILSHEVENVENRRVQQESQNRLIYKKKKLNAPFHDFGSVEDRQDQQEPQNRLIYKKKKLNAPFHDFGSVEDRQDKSIIEKKIVMPKKNSNNNNEKQLLQATFNNKCNKFIQKFNLFNQWKNAVTSMPVSQKGKIGISFETPEDLKFNQPRGIFFNNSQSKDLVQVKIPKKDPTQMINRQVVQHFSEIQNNLNSKNVEKFGKLVDKAIDKMSWFVQNFNKGLSTVDEAEELEESQSFDSKSTDETVK